MEIRSIPDTEEVNEVEKPDCEVSGKGLYFNRVETEYGEEEQSYDLHSIEEILEKYQTKSLIYAISLFLYLISLYKISEPSLFFSPLLLYEFYCLYKNALQLITELPVLNQYWKSEFFVKSLDNIFNILLFSYLFFYASSYISVLYPLLVPLFLSSLTRFMIKVNTANTCVSFSNMVASSFRWAKLVFCINLVLKLDFNLNLSWAAVFWPVFLLSFISSFICLASFIMILLSLCTKEHDHVHFYSHLWVIYTLLAGSLIFLLLFLNFDPAYPLWVLVPLTYFILLALATFKIKKLLAAAFLEIFVNDASPHSQIELDSPLPVPGFQNAYIESNIANKLTKALKSTPRILVNFTNPQVQTKREKLQRKKICKTLSQAVDNKPVSNIHIRSKSSFWAGSNSDAIKVPCKFCQKKEGSNKFVECEHGELCNDCADFYLKSKKDCYICHNIITGFVQEGNRVNTEDFK